MRYLLIENPGVAPKEAFTLLGASSKAFSNNPRCIGKFGSGNKYAVCLLLRLGLTVIVYAGNLRMEFTTVERTVEGRTYNVVKVKYSGKENGVSKNYSEELSFVTEYGATDWQDTFLACREFVSNAIDRALEEGEQPYLNDEKRLEMYRLISKDYEKVKVSVVDEMRASAGHTRVYIPYAYEVEEFHKNLGKYFLHFSEPESLDLTVLPKKGRSLNGSDSAVIYRRGVYVRTVRGSTSLFDYNLEDLKLDESRQVDDYAVQSACELAFRKASTNELEVYFNSWMNGCYWEQQFDFYGFEKNAVFSAIWKEALQNSLGENGAFTSDSAAAAVKSKGYVPHIVSESLLSVAKVLGIRTCYECLTEDEIRGRSVSDPSPEMQDIFNRVLNHIDFNKPRPSLKMFTGLGAHFYWRGDVIYINSSCSNPMLKMISCVCHYACDSQDAWNATYQEMILNLIAKNI